AESCPPEQIGIGGSEDASELCRLVDRLSARLGPRRVRRLVAQNSHIPELAEAVLPAQTVNGDAGWAGFRQYREETKLPSRPLRLLARPEPIATLPEAPPAPPLPSPCPPTLPDRIP